MANMKYANVSKEGGNEHREKRKQTPTKRKSEGLEVVPKGVETEKQRVGGWFTGRLEEERGEVMRPVTAFTPRLCGN